MAATINEFIYKLETPVSYHGKGNEEQAYELILKAPSNKQRRECAQLRQGFFKALNDLQSSGSKEQSEGGSQDIGGKEVLTMILMSGVDYVEYVETFRDLALNDIVWINEQQRVTSPIFDNMSENDTQNMMGEYIANFLIGSWMSGLATS